MPYTGHAWNPCSCGCGEFTSRTYAPGHDARSRGMLLRFWRFQSRPGDRLGLYAISRETLAAFEAGRLQPYELSAEAERILSLRGWLPNQHGTSQLNRAQRRAAPRRQAAPAESESRTPEVRSAMDEDWTWIDGLALTDRNFGIEMEFYGCTPAELIFQASLLGLNVQHMGYTHQTTPHWKIVSDGSVTGTGTGGNGGLELVSPILNGYEGVRALAAASRALALAGARVNRTCGVHVHLDASDLSPNQIGNVAANYAEAQRAIDYLVPSSRRSTVYNRYCHPIPDYAVASLRTAQTNSDLASAMPGRYHKVNLQSLHRHGTIEFRQHAGSIDGQKIAHWLSLMQAIVESTKSGVVFPNTRNLEGLLAVTNLSSSTVSYFTARDANFRGAPVAV